MLKILILDDDSQKIKRIKAEINNIPEIVEEDIVSEVCNAEKN